jgi:hypothetical protein
VAWLTDAALAGMALIFGVGIFVAAVMGIARLSVEADNPNSPQ